MHAVIKNNEIVQTIQPFTRLIVDGNDYGSNWSVNMTVQELADIGVIEIVEQPEADQRFYWTGSSVELVGGVPTRVQTATPKQLEDVTETPEGATEPVTTKGLKTQWAAQIRQTTNSLLAGTDWMVIRKFERGIEIPADVAAYRAGVLAECDRLVAAIAAATDIEAFIAVVATQNWPTQPE